LRSNSTVQPRLPPSALPQETVNPELPANPELSNQPDVSPLEEEPIPMDTDDITVDSLLNIRCVKNFKEMSAANKVTDTHGKTHAVVKITSDDNKGEPFWVKLSTLLGLYEVEHNLTPVSGRTTKEQNKSTFTQLKSFTETTKSLAPLFSHTQVQYLETHGDKIFNGIIYVS
jgi:hypothetical protein